MPAYPERLMGQGFDRCASNDLEDVAALLVTAPDADTLARWLEAHAAL